MAPLVTKEEHERLLQEVREGTADPVEGIFGPRSTVWEISRESILLLGGGRAALLQLAHPYVAHAIAQHSNATKDVQGRFRRTFINVFAMVFGDLESALGSARRVHSLHETIVGAIDETIGLHQKGSRYHANDPEALLWVAATLWETTILVYELFIRKLTLDEKEAYYEQSRLFARLFGLSDSLLPRNWGEFLSYNETMWQSQTLGVGEPAARIAREILTPPRLAAWPLFHWIRSFTAATLPERFQREFGLLTGPLDRILLGTTVPIAKGAVKILPSQFRHIPSYLDARRRLAGKEGRDPVGKALTRIVLAMMKGSGSPPVRAGQ